MAHGSVSVPQYPVVLARVKREAMPLPIFGKPSGCLEVRAEREMASNIETLQLEIAA
uniref:Uncharacterized protein n=1 Tax=Candidatus Kentrum sp. LPFa TaxID=2126335 RepID=A0A450WM06_9GAMM|nr:MAG: hypothetical protein BECKLPF1236A_GA0070988_101876 [Candidatus Kentron sp. LPFa]VFK33288.1 MAG: hypothetical protein BECKLPF1236C_GA0070990_102006 [Candidatus Kentron sp. LPFa]